MISHPEKPDIYWIDANIQYLTTRLGKHPPFDSSGFSWQIATLQDTRPPYHPDCHRALSHIFIHLHIPEIPVYYEKGLNVPGIFRYSIIKGKIAEIEAKEIRISDSIQEICNREERGNMIGAILAHELAHYYLMYKGIVRDVNDNERLTDLGIIVLGLGWLYFNGTQQYITSRNQRPGYLSYPDMVYAFREYTRENRFPMNYWLSGFTKEAANEFFRAETLVSEYLLTLAKEEQKERREKGKKSFIRALGEYPSKISESLSLIEAGKERLKRLEQRQDMLNQTRDFWDITAEDDIIMSEFSRKRYSYSFEREIATIERTIRVVSEKIASYDENPDWCGTERFIIDVNRIGGEIHQLNTNITTFSDSFNQVEDVQLKYLRKIDTIQNMHADISHSCNRCLKSLETISANHAFYQRNPDTFQKYACDERLLAEINEVQNPCISEYLISTKKEADENCQRLSAPVENYPDLLPSLKEITSLRREAEYTLKEGTLLEKKLHILLTSQKDHSKQYLKKMNRVIHFLERGHITCEKDKQTARKMRDNMEIILKNHARFSIPLSHERIFLDILEDVYYGTSEAACTRLISSMRTLHENVVRETGLISSASPSTLITPAIQYITQALTMKQELDALHKTLSGWNRLLLMYMRRLAEENKTEPEEQKSLFLERLMNAAGEMVSFFIGHKDEGE